MSSSRGACSRVLSGAVIRQMMRVIRSVGASAMLTNCYLADDKPPAGRMLSETGELFCGRGRVCVFCAIFPTFYFLVRIRFCVCVFVFLCC